MTIDKMTIDELVFPKSIYGNDVVRIDFSDLARQPKYEQFATEKMQKLQDLLNDVFVGSWRVGWKWGNPETHVVSCYFRFGGWNYERNFQSKTVEGESLEFIAREIQLHIWRKYGEDQLMKNGRV